MRQPHPILSPTGLLITLLVLAGLGVALWRTGGAMFSPGKLTAMQISGTMLGGVAAHADIVECQRCHLPLQTQQDALCLDCHTQIDEEITNSSELHARVENARQCYACHPDHRGVDFNPTDDARMQFDHSLASFGLIWHQVNYDATPMACEACHAEPGTSVDNQACIECHADHDQQLMAQHQQDFGADCLACHDGLDSMTNFEHAQTDFPLEGLHTEARCVDCHQNGAFSGTPGKCAACHTEPQVHAELFDDDCAACHSARGWLPANLDGTTFDHANQTRFVLDLHRQDYAEQPITCLSCHGEDLKKFDQNTCNACHAAEDAAFVDEHQAQFGSDCLSCHDGAGRMENFDHARVFTLTGQHIEIECAACHIEHMFAGTPTLCYECHAEPEIHMGVFGLECQNCHTAAAWAPAQLSYHSFPLDHGEEGEIPCLTCHPSTYIEYTCDECHAPAEMVNEHREEDILEIVGQCIECHPTGLEDEGDFEDD